MRLNPLVYLAEDLRGMYPGASITISGWKRKLKGYILDFQCAGNHYTVEHQMAMGYQLRQVLEDGTEVLCASANGPVAILEGLEDLVPRF